MQSNIKDNPEKRWSQAKGDRDRSTYHPPRGRRQSSWVAGSTADWRSATACSQPIQKTRRVIHANLSARCTRTVGVVPRPVYLPRKFATIHLVCVCVCVSPPPVPRANLAPGQNVLETSVHDSEKVQPSRFSSRRGDFSRAGRVIHVATDTTVVATFSLRRVFLKSTRSVNVSRASRFFLFHVRIACQ